MSKIKVLPEGFLTFYITHLLFLHTGHCQFPGRRFDVSRTRYREQIPGAYRSPQPWNDRQSFARDNYSNRPSVTSYRGYLNNHSPLRNIQTIREQAPPAQTLNYDQIYGTASRHSHHSVSPIRYNHLRDRNRYSIVRNRDGRMYDQRPNVVPFARTNERFRYSSRRGVNSQINYPESRRQFSPYNRNVALNDRSRLRAGTITQGRSSVYRPTYNSPTATFPTERSHDTSNGNQFSDRFNFPRRVQSVADGIRNYSPMSTNRDNLSQHQLTTSRVANRPRLPAERNEVYQYRTSVMRAPQSEFSVSKNYVDRQRITDRSVQSESLPFEPLSLRYQGFRNSKIAGQQGNLPDRATNFDTRNTGRSLETGTRQTEAHFGRTPDAQLTDRSSRFDNGNTNGDMNRGTFQPVVGTVQRHRFPQRTTHFPQRTLNYGSRNTIGRITGNDRRFQLELQAQGRYIPNRNTHIADRNTARLGNTRTVSPGSYFERMNSGTTNFNQRQATPISFNRNAQTVTGFQRGLGQTTQHTTGLQRRLGQTISSNNDLSFRTLQQNEHIRRFRQNNAYTNSNAPDETLREILGISRAGLENALKPRPQIEQSVTGRNNNPISNNVNVVGRSGNQRQRQRSGVPTIDVGKDTDTDDMAELRADLIEDIRRSMDIADQMNLIRNRHVSDKEQTNNLLFPQVSSENTNKERVTILTIRPSNNNGQSRNIIILRHNPRDENVDEENDDIEDGFIGGLSVSNDESPSDSQISNTRHSHIESDEENEGNEGNDHS